MQLHTMKPNNVDGYHAGIRGLLLRAYPTLLVTSWCLSSVYARGLADSWVVATILTPSEATSHPVAW